MGIPSGQSQPMDGWEEDRSMATLDVGSGGFIRGDVGVDLYADSSPHIDQRPGQLEEIDRSRPFIRADACHLPFRDDAFERVSCIEVLEHVENPVELLQELLRVTNNEVFLTTPHRFGTCARMPYHRNYFSHKWFMSVLNKMDCRHLVKTTARRIHPLVPILLPEHLIVMIWKR